MESKIDQALIKTRYYPGKLLHAADFINEQEYGSRKLEFLNRKFQGCGIIEGLELKTGQEGGLKLTAGSALDPAGRIIIAPQDTEWDVKGIKGLNPEKEPDFILGIRYDEQPAESEQAILEGDKTVCQVARIRETFSLGAYSEEEWRRLWAQTHVKERMFTQERVLYDGEAVKLILKIPRLIPEDSMFRMRLQMRARDGASAKIRWRGAVKMQGAFFAETGKSFEILEKEWTGFTGELSQEWEICTEENRRLPVELELNRMEIAVEIFGKTETVESASSRLSIETVSEYRRTVQSCLRGSERESQPVRDGLRESTRESQPVRDGLRESARESQPVQGWLWESAGENRAVQSCLRESVGESRPADWVPLGHLRVEKTGEEDEYRFVLQQDFRPRVYVVHPGGEALLERVEEEDGIVEIPWRGLLKRLGGKRNPFWTKPPLPEPSPELPPPAFPKPDAAPEQLKEWLRENRREEIRRGVAVIPVPNRYRKGRILYSEEISYGFPGEEALIRWGVLYEGCHFLYEYGNGGRPPHSIVYGEQKLFADRWEAGWESRWNGNRDVREQALRQNVEKGTFQIAVTLSRGFRRSRGREVTISWIAYRTV
ncbi:MAG: hypothetical protein NC399_07455 [Muribaculum sp.]|nr:hypothetical protein [Muribaculum sp.]